MRVRGKADVDVEITTSELVSALKEEVYATLDLPSPKEGRVFVKEDSGIRVGWAIQRTVHTSHSFEIEDNLGPALDEDVEVFTAFHTIAEFLKD
tara:strand:+ start:2428 stop:2709 length:282 start_codon:yes stop_codon:yes gene_type:complete